MILFHRKHASKDEIDIERQIHPMYEEWTKMKMNDAQAPDSLSKPIIGKYQYIYSKDSRKISLVELPDYFGDGKTLWEICDLAKLSKEDTDAEIERFDTKEDAEQRIEEILLKNG